MTFDRTESDVVMNWDQTPAEVPNAKLAQVDPHVALRLLLDHIIGRLRVIDRAQVYIINSVENPPSDEKSLVERERFALEAKSNALLRQWVYACKHADETSDSDRPSQTNIAINVLEPPKIAKTEHTALGNRIKLISIIFIAAGSLVVGMLQALGILK